MIRDSSFLNAVSSRDVPLPLLPSFLISAIIVLPTYRYATSISNVRGLDAYPFAHYVLCLISGHGYASSRHCSRKAGRRRVYRPIHKVEDSSSVDLERESGIFYAGVVVVRLGIRRWRI